MLRAPCCLVQFVWLWGNNRIDAVLAENNRLAKTHQKITPGMVLVDFVFQCRTNRVPCPRRCIPLYFALARHNDIHVHTSFPKSFLQTFDAQYTRGRPAINQSRKLTYYKTCSAPINPRGVNLGMRSRFIEAQDDHHTNHGKFFLFQFGLAEHKYRSAITHTPLLSSLPPVRRFNGPISDTSLFLVDLQTQEGMIFDPSKPPDIIQRSFLIHPLHVCILYFPLMMLLARKCNEIWKLPNLITFPIDEVIAQPGVLVDATGQQVRSRSEWSPRRPIVARLRNREVPEDKDPEDGQGLVSQDEMLEMRVGTKPVW